MMPPWRYFEHLNEIVYVADPETYELIYLNQYGRSAFQVEEREYRGKRCHEVLQGLQQVCPFCTNGQLVEGEFLEWTYHNPVLQETFSIKDTLIHYQGRQYRMEFAINMDRKTENENGGIPGSTLINECLLVANSTHDLNKTLEYLGTHITCRALAIFEGNGEWLVNTYLWSGDGQKGKQEVFSLGFEQYVSWSRIFSDNQPVLLYDTVEVCRDTPALGELLQLKGTQRAILVPLVEDKKAIGFLCIYDPEGSQMEPVANLGMLLSVYIVATIQQRELVKNLEQLSYHDQMTGALNRYALKPYLDQPSLACDTGVVYCDVVGLKSINDLLGHANGDRLIVQVYYILGSVFSSDQIYRVGGDEFLVLCQGQSEGEFQQQVDRLREEIIANNCNLSIGSAWAGAGEDDLSNLLVKADAKMYEDKRHYYQQRDPLTGKIRQTQRRGRGEPSEVLPGQSMLRNFLENYYFDADTFFRSISMPGVTFYFYCGDLKRNVYYISDNLRDDFHFSDNLVYDFITLLEQRIYEPDRELHAADAKSMLDEKRKLHSIRYRIYNKNGDLIWLHCRGIMQWNADLTEPLFFSGTMVELSSESEVDPVTGLLDLSLALKKLDGLRERQEMITMLCVTFRDYGDINHVFGRETGNEILRKIGQHLEQRLGTQFNFFRMDGLKILAVAQGQHDLHRAAEEVRAVVERVYNAYGLHMVYPCAIGVLTSQGEKQVSAQELVDNVENTARMAKVMPGVDFLEFNPEENTDMGSNQKDLGIMLSHCISHQFEGFSVVIQPQVEANSGRIFGGEALVRWRNRDKDIPPSKFIPILEQNGLILPVGRWVMEQALRSCSAILQRQPDFVLSVNISYLQILDPTFFSYIQGLLEQYQVPAENLLVELTETHFDQMPAHLEQFVSRCQAAGIRFAIDDFGSAYSGLQVLLQYPAELVKLDRNLLYEIKSSDQKINFIMSIVYACHRFGKKVCVEGVETEEDLLAVRQTGCDYIQGFYFYRPMPPEELLAALPGKGGQQEHG